MALCPAMPDLAPGFALGSLEPEETEAVEHHLPSCPACAKLVEDARRTAAVLPFLVKAVAPPPDVRAALFTRIAQTQQFAAGATPHPVATPRVDPSVTFPPSRLDPKGERVARAPRRRLRLPTVGDFVGRTQGQTAPSSGTSQPAHPASGSWRNWPGPLVPIMTPTVPLLVILAVVGGWAMTQYNQANEMATYQDLWGTMDNVLQADDGTMFNMESTDAVPPTVKGRVVAELDAERAMLMTWGLDDRDGSVSYAVWVERNGRFIPAGDLDVDDRGHAREMIELDGRLREFQRVVVTATTVDADGVATVVDVLTAAITPAGPAGGGLDGTEGSQSVGSIGLDAVQMAARSR